MNRHPPTVRPDLVVSDVAAFLEQSESHGAPAAPPDQRLLGIITLTDVRQAIRQGLHDRPVESIATTGHLISVYPDHTLNGVVQQMGLHEVSLLPVVAHADDERLVGVLTMPDIVRAYAQKKMA